MENHWPGYYTRCLLSSRSYHQLRVRTSAVVVLNVAGAGARVIAQILPSALWSTSSPAREQFAARSDLAVEAAAALSPLTRQPPRSELRRWRKLAAAAFTAALYSTSAARTSLRRRE